MFLISSNALSFTAKDIRVEGLQRISVGTVFNSIPFRPGSAISDEAGREIIRTLFKTGLFKDVQVVQEGKILVIIVQERPVIAEINISGNKDIDDDALKTAMRDAGFVEGRVYNPYLLEKIKNELKTSYYDRGKYSVIIESTTSPLQNNRTAVDIIIREGLTAKIRKINIIGNKAFSDRKIKKEMSLTTGRALPWFGSSNQYSKQKFEADLEAIRSLYLDNGYIKSSIESTQVNISPEKDDIYLTLNLKEGEVYRISDIKLAGRAILNREELFPLIKLRRGTPFSRKEVVASAERLLAALADKGYGAARVNPVPHVDEENKTVVISFYIEPGDLVYVRRINIKGNTGSQDRVLRREFRQQEAAPYSAEKVEQSKQRLLRLGFFTHVDVKTLPVPGRPDQVDIEVTVKEKASREIMMGVGYSQDSGASLQARLSDDNFFGTGKRVSIGFNTSDTDEYGSISYTDPYYTIDGISLGFTTSFRKRDLSELSTSSSVNYGLDQGVLGMNFGFPFSDDDRLSLFLNAEYTKVKFSDNPIPSLKQPFEATYGDQDDFFNYKLGLSWTHDTRDKVFFTTKGSQIKAKVEVALPGSDQEFYKVSYSHKQYFSITDDLSFTGRIEFSGGDEYGDTKLYPFYENFFAGGLGSVRGFESYSLGPRALDTDGDLRSIGGKARTTASAEIWFPFPFSKESDNIKAVAFIDAGQVFEDFKVETKDLRYSVGVGLSWLSPLGLINMSYAIPQNDESGDDIEEFQFSFGTRF